MNDDRIWVFAGPSAPRDRRPRSEAFAWRPPAVAGDGLAALAARPRAVVLIDGLFDHQPAIRHKELMALAEGGVPVFGAASMGALRAAELHRHGMTGVGHIFQAYARGRLVGDDEVAVLHGPAEMDWAALTVPLVNVRATLARAARQRVVGLAAARQLREHATHIFFQDRTWRTLLETAAAAGDVAAGALERLRGWLPDGEVDLKQLDAQACLATALARTRRAGLRPQPPPASAPTAFTEALARQISSGLRPNPSAF